MATVMPLAIYARAVSIIGWRPLRAGGLVAAVFVAVSACSAGAGPTVEPSTSRPPAVESTSVAPSSSPALEGPAVQPPSAAETGEVARFWFARPGNNNTLVGPYAVENDVLIVRGACRSVTGTMTWKVFDNSEEVDASEEVKIVDEGELTCDGTTQRAEATIGRHRELGILGTTGAPPGQDAKESAWLTLANE